MKFKIEEIANVIMGQSPKSEFYNTDGVGMPFLQGNRTFGDKYPIFDTWTTKITKPANAGDVIMSVRAPVGDLNITPVAMCLGRGVCSIRMKNGNNEFAYYLMKYYKPQLLRHESGSIFGSVNRNDINQLEVDVPEHYSVQKRIARFLSMIDDKIELNKNINKNLQQQVSALFDNWFVDFGHFDGDMPIDWHIGKLANIANVTSGKRPPLKSSEKTASATIPLIGAASVMGYTSDTLYNSPILVTGRVGTHGVVQRFYSPCWPSDNTLVITSPYYEFTDQVLRRVDYINMNRGSTQPLITQTDLKNVEIVIPSDGVLKEFELLAGTLMQKHAENCQENQRLCELRDALLPRLMSGEIDVSDIQF